MYLQRTVSSVEHENAPTPLFRFPNDPLVSQIRGSLLRQGGQKPYATHSATMAVLEASGTMYGLQFLKFWIRPTLTLGSWM